jgi:hypothetical protein
MPRNTKVTLLPGVWTQLTDANVTSITFQNQGGDSVLVAGTVGATPPTTLDTAIKYGPGLGEANAALADLFPGIAATRVYAYSAHGGQQVFVSHA